MEVIISIYFGTGNAISLPERFYFIGGILTHEFSRIDAYRMALYHRLDLSATYTPQQKRKEGIQAIEYLVFTMYNHLNPYFYYYEQEGSAVNGTLKVTAKQVSLFPVIPSITWNLKW